MGEKNRENKVKINDDAKRFAKSTLKRYKKDNKGYFDSKKELKESYCQHLLELLPGAIDFCVKSGHINNDEVKEVRDGIYSKIASEDFTKIVKKEIKNDNEIENIKLFPIVAKDILAECKRVNDANRAEDPNAALYDVTHVSELSQMIMKKKLKKMEKEGISTALAFDLLSIIPTKKAIEYSQFYRIKSLYDCMYEHAKEEKVPFGKIINIMIPEEFYPVFISFALLERKEKFSKLTDSQKELYLEISTWCFDTMNRKLSNKELDAVITLYINSRKKDESQGKDGNRRYALATLSADEYERIAKTITNIIANDDSVKKYLN